MRENSWTVSQCARQLWTERREEEQGEEARSGGATVAIIDVVALVFIVTFLRLVISCPT